MLKAQKTLRKRITVTLPMDTIRVLEKTVKKGDRSETINRALIAYLGKLKKQSLRRRLKEEAQANAAEDLRLAHEWFHLDQEAWEQAEETESR